MCSPSALLKVNHLCIRYLWFESVRGDFLEGLSYASRCRLSLCSSTKTSILCSESLKTGVPDPKKAQKYRFCARNARKRGSRRQIKHKNPIFVLERPENGGSEGKKRTKMAFLRSKSKRLRDYVLTPIYEASTFAEKQLKMEELIPVQSASRYRKTIDDYKLRLKDNPDLKLSEYCKEVHTNYRRVLGWTRRHGISISALKRKASGGTAWGLSDTEPGNAFIQFVPSSRLTSASLLGISITFPDGVNLTLQESSVESVISLLTIYKSRHGGAKSCSD